MPSRTYFLVNDTRYDNHHGGLTVVRNLHAAMTARGWSCTGSLPVSATVHHLARVREPLGRAQQVIINGEGSLHHNSRNAQRLHAICATLQATHPVVILNALWQDNDPASWKPILDGCTAVYARDLRSQNQLMGIGIDAGYAPDLTFYDYPLMPGGNGARYACTDSVREDWTEWALAACKGSPDMDFLTLFTRRLAYTRGMRDWSRRVKYALYPPLEKALPTSIPARYCALNHAMDDTPDLLARIAGARSICVARYHALCFALQQNRPFVAVPSNSYKNESLLEEVGLPHDLYLYRGQDASALRAALDRAVERHEEVKAAIDTFNHAARRHIDAMFDTVVSQGDAKAVGG